jgi:hypothetical protein
VALDVSPVGVGLYSENRSLDLPVSSDLATEQSAADRERSLRWAKLWQRPRVWHLGERPQRVRAAFAHGMRPEPGPKMMIETVRRLTLFL